MRRRAARLLALTPAAVLAWGLLCVHAVAAARGPSAKEWASLQSHNGSVWYLAGLAPACGFNTDPAIDDLQALADRYDLSTAQSQALWRDSQARYAEAQRQNGGVASAAVCQAARARLDGEVAAMTAR